MKFLNLFSVMDFGHTGHDVTFFVDKTRNERNIGYMIRKYQLTTKQQIYLLAEVYRSIRDLIYTKEQPISFQRIKT